MPTTPHHPTRRRHPHRPPLLAVALLIASGLSLSLLGVALSPDDALADIYKYRKPNGELVVTTEKRSDLELVEVIRTSPRRKPRARRRKRPSPAASDARSRRARAPATPRAARYDDLIREAADAYGLPFAFVKAVVRVESNFNPDAVSRAGAMGLMQLMPATAEEMGVTDPFDPRQNVFGGTRYLRLLTNRYNGDINLVLSGYNAGPGNVDKYRGIPFEATQGYVRDVYRWYQTYKPQE